MAPSQKDARPGGLGSVAARFPGPLASESLPGGGTGAPWRRGSIRARRGPGCTVRPGAGPASRAVEPGAHVGHSAEHVLALDRRVVGGPVVLLVLAGAPPDTHVSGSV